MNLNYIAEHAFVPGDFALIIMKVADVIVLGLIVLASASALRRNRKTQWKTGNRIIPQNV